MRHSPLSKTPTKQLPVIPGVTLDDNGKLIEEDEEALENEKNTLKEKSVPMEEQNGSNLKKNHGMKLMHWYAQFSLENLNSLGS